MLALTILYKNNILTTVIYSIFSIAGICGNNNPIVNLKIVKYACTYTIINAKYALKKKNMKKYALKIPAIYKKKMHSKNVFY